MRKKEEKGNSIKIKESGADKVFNIVNTTILSVFALVILLPIIYVLSVSFISNAELASRSGLIIFPEKPSLDAYKMVLFGSDDIVQGYIVTLSRTLIGTFLNMLFSCFLAYLLSRKDLPFRKSITMYLLITMMFSGGLIPTYIIVKSTGLLNSFWVYIIPTLVSAWNVFILRNFMMEIPSELIEAAEIDGCSQLRILFRIMIPLSKAAIVTVSLFYAVAHWNAWFDAYLYVKIRELYPLQYILRNILINATLSLDKSDSATMFELLGMRPPTRAIQNAALVITTLPIVCVYPFLQKYFVKGVMVGSIKG